jgi:hypothetical protein
MDNATFHKGGRIEQLIQEAGCELDYSQPASWKVEHFFTQLFGA